MCIRVREIVDNLGIVILIAECPELIPDGTSLRVRQSLFCIDISRDLLGRLARIERIVDARHVYRSLRACGHTVYNRAHGIRPV